ncbi:MAG: hypothetical protein K2K31_03515 [Clostridia bacterium]|nr:hypothetical protein [Clostridia bacterium]
MDWKTSLYFLIPAVVILLFVFPIFVEFRVSFNPLYNRGVVALFVFKKKIFYYIISFHGKYIKLENEKDTKMQEIEFSSPEFEVIEEFMRQLKDKIRLKECLIHYQIGTGDAYSSALVCGFLNVLIMQAFLYVKSHKPTASLCVYDTVSYNKVQCEIAGFVSISVSFFDVAYSYLYSVIITKTK